MTTGPKSIGQLVAEARAERDEAIALAEDADVTGWDRKIIDQAIRAFAEAGEPFSANDMRELLPDVRPALIGARFLAASNAGDIRKVGWVTSTKRNTHAKPVATWIGTSTAEVAAPEPAPPLPEHDHLMRPRDTFITDDVDEDVPMFDLEAS